VKEGRRMAGSNNRYVYGSAAEKIRHDRNIVPNSSNASNSRYYDPYEQNAVLKSKKAARINARIKKRIIVNIFLIFGMCAVIMARYAQISQMNYDNYNLSKEYTALQNENTQLSLEIEKAMSLQSIREIAVKKLNMHTPDKSQIVYISVPKQDVIVLAEKKEPKIMVFAKDATESIKRFLNIFGLFE